MKILRMITLILLLCPLSVRAQDGGETQTQMKARLMESLALKVEYFGELVLHPGLSVGLSYTLLQKKWLAVHWDADLGAYWHRWNNTSAFVKTSVGSRFLIGQAFADINLGLGYMHSWAEGTLYQRAEGGDVEKASNWGHPHFMPNASFLLGWDGSKKRKLPWMVHIGPEVYLQSSFNHIYLPHVALKIGFSYKINQG